jgi:hypothetical protein
MTATEQNTSARRGVSSLFIVCCFLVFVADAFPSRRLVQSSSATQAKDAPASKSQPPAQPIPYSHKKHLALGLPCGQCHPNPEPGDRMTLPASSTCMACHVTIAKQKPDIQKLTELAKSSSPIPWVRIYVLPGWDMEVMTKATNVTTMAGCIDCHRKNDASTGCKYCHAEK